MTNRITNQSPSKRTHLKNAWSMSWTIAIRELVSLFRVPAGWIIIALFTFLSAILFVNQTLIPGQPGSMRYFFAPSTWLLIPIAPAISMRLMSEEYRTGSFESLRTTPAGDWTVAIGKYLGSVLFLALMLTPSLGYAAVLVIVSDPIPDPGPIFSGYLMLLLVGSLYLSIGLLASSLTSSQTLAFLGTMMALVLFMVVTSVLAPQTGPTYAPILSKLSVITRATELGKGVIDTSSIAFFIIFSTWMIALTAGVLESKRLARSKLSLGFMGSLFVIASTLAVVFASALTNTHTLRVDVTSTSAHKLSPRATNMVDALPGETTILLALNQSKAQRREIDLVTDVLETYDNASELLTSTVINLADPSAKSQIDDLVNTLRAREASTLASNHQTLVDSASTLSNASTILESFNAPLLAIRDALGPQTPANATNRAFFDQRATLVKLGAQDLRTASNALSSIGPDQSHDTETPEIIALLNAQLAQLEDLKNQLSAFANADEIQPAARIGARNLNSSLSPLIDDLAVLTDNISRLKPSDAHRVERVLETGEALLIVGPPEIGIAAIDLDSIIPSAKLLEDAGLSPAGIIGPRAQELIATTLGQLVIQSHPIVVFVHASTPNALLSNPQAPLAQTKLRLNQQGIDTYEWAPLHETDQPSFSSIDPLGQRPVVYIVIATDSAAGSDDTGTTGARKATTLAQITTQLIDMGHPVLVTMSPSIFASFDNQDPLIPALKPFGIVPDPSKALLTNQISTTKRTANPATVFVPSTSTNHPLADAVQGLSTALPWSIPMTIDPQVGTETHPILTMPGSDNTWAEHDWIQLWSTPASSRQFLREHPDFNDETDIRRDQWTLAVAAQRSTPAQQRILVVGSNAWMFDALTLSKSQLVDGRMTTNYPGNLTLLESSIAWLADLDELIAPGVQSKPIATIKPLDNQTLSTYRWILMGALPGCILLIGVSTRFIFG